MEAGVGNRSDQNFDLVVVSAFGRGQWLATEFASRGWRVELLDVTSQLGKFDLRDVEGPFGLFEGQDLHASQRARLNDEGELKPVTSGFTIWPPQGPLELRSEVTPFHLRAREIPIEVETYLRNPDPFAREAVKEREALKKLHFSHSWLAQFAHVVTSAAHHENYIALESESVAPLFSPYSVRQLTEAGQTKGSRAAETLGVKIREAVHVKDIKLDGKNVTEISYSQPKDRDATARARSFVWCLSYQETKQISDSILRSLYPREWPDAPWAWQRISFEAHPQDLLGMLPLSVAIIDDVDLAWTRANLILVRRREGEARFDAWVKVPTWMKRETDAFEQVRNEVHAKLEKRFPEVKLKSVHQAMTPLLWPLWSKDEFAEMQGKLAPTKLSNFFISAPGMWTSIDWLGRYRYETKVAAALEKLKTQWDAAARKLELAEQRRRARQ